MTDLNKERDAFELFELNKRPCATPASLFERFDSNDLGEDEQHYVGRYVDSYMQEKWELWQKAKAQAVQQSFEIGRLQDRITELLDERQDLYAQINNDQAVPETHVVVPKLPTPKMIDATWDFDEEILEMSSNTRNEFIWKKMVEASESGAEG
ncbi:hypothetical protein ACG9XL_02775 [Acinetobacter nosocomialis]|uniref:hypothetical protein n=1 Tax=Acinetobacter nosocomialis TaxID=106654 RepID=UPI003AF57297